ncbi:unnamed protein product [Owenia fusiformis]|uniref:Mitochondrial genome maintenance exonuclease 1 n=1 Tax=Owenia fusiformis TaxID=6347 RepID=A0A8J1Y0X1_OWEFU|nr:unnamed protein product [Owenia fusiformis]
MTMMGLRHRSLSLIRPSFCYSVHVNAFRTETVKHNSDSDSEKKMWKWKTVQEIQSYKSAMNALHGKKLPPHKVRKYKKLLDEKMKKADDDNATKREYSSISADNTIDPSLSQQPATDDRPSLEDAPIGDSGNNNSDINFTNWINLIKFYPLVNESTAPEETLPYKEIHHKLPSVSKIINDTMSAQSRYNLKQWEKKMIAQLGEEGFKEYKSTIFRNGHNFHSSIESLMNGTPESDIEVLEANQGHWESLRHVFPNIDDVVKTECHVTHPILQYHGIFDCVAKYKGTLCLIDWKTSKKAKPQLRDTFDNPLQIVAYVGAVNFDPNYLINIHEGLLVVANEDGKPANVHQMSLKVCHDYWNEWIKRLKKFYALDK